MRSLNLDQLRAFIEVVERGSFTAAAKELNLSQPAVTHQIRELEKRFKRDLIERLGKRAYLTAAGERLIGHARHLLEEDALARASMRRFDDGWTGRVRVGTSATVLMYALPPILQKLKSGHPKLEIVLKAGLTSATLKALKANTLDFGLCALPVEDDAFDAVHLFEDELVAILPKALGNIPKRVTPDFLAGCPLILGNEESQLRRSVAAWLGGAGVSPNPIMTLTMSKPLRALLRSAWAPRWCRASASVAAMSRLPIPSSRRFIRVSAGQSAWSSCAARRQTTPCSLCRRL
jgi:DNA-binding transcriptional LysR family regulator